MESLKRRFLPAALMAAALASTAHAAPLTLRQCIDAAYGLSPALHADELDIQAAGQEIERQRRALLPSVSATLVAGLVEGYPVTPFAIVTGEDVENGANGGGTVRDVQTVKTHSTTSVRGVTRTFDTATSTQVNSQVVHQRPRADHAFYSAERVDLTWPLFQDGSILGLNDAPAVASARAGRAQLEWTRNLAEEKVVFDLCNAFFIAQWYQRKLERDGARVTLSRERLGIVKEEYGLQLMLKQDVELAQAQLDADERTLAATRQSVRDSFAVLALLIGRPTGRVAALDAASPLFPSLPPLGGLLERTRTIHPAVGVQETLIEQARAKVRLDNAALLPAVVAGINATAGQNLDHIAAASVDSPTQYAGAVTVNVPIFDWGSRLAELRESRDHEHAERVRLEQVRMDISTAIARLYDAIHDLDRQLAAATQALVSAGNAERLAGEQRAVGGIDQLALVTARQARLAAEDVVQNARLGQVQAYVQLEQAAGGAWRWTR